MRYTSTIVAAAGLSGMALAQSSDLLASASGIATALGIPEADVKSASSVVAGFPPYVTAALTDPAARASVSADFASGTPTWLSALPSSLRSSFVAEYSEISSDANSATTIGGVVVNGPGSGSNSSNSSTTMVMTTTTTTGTDGMMMTTTTSSRTTTPTSSSTGSFNGGQGSSDGVKLVGQTVLAMAGVAGFLGVMLAL